MTIVTVGIDLAKNVFAVHGVNESGKPALVRPEGMRSGNTYGVTDGDAVNGSGAGGIRLGGWQFA